MPVARETAIGMMYNQHVNIPDQFGDDFIKLASICKRCVESMLECVDELFTNFNSAARKVGVIDELESQADAIEQAIIERAFASSMDGFEKILIRDLAKHIASVSDRAENVADRINIIVAKRSV